MKKFLLSLAMLCTTMMLHAANTVWCMVTNGGQSIPVSNVSYILAEGTSPETFSIVLKSGSPVENVGMVKFAQLEATGIDAVPTTDGSVPMLARAFDGQLMISNAAAGLPVRVLSVNGQLVKSSVTDNGSTELFIGDLTSGVYILKVGDTAVKFMKK